MVDVITQHLDVWTSAIFNKSTAGRGTSNKQTAYGIKKLRELILELAVRGKLVPQDSNDEPANVLLEKISKEKARLVNEGKIKKQISLPEISEDEKSFRLPTGWEWVRLQDVSSYIQRGKGPKYADQGQVRVISQKCIQWNGFDLLQAKYVDDDSITNYQPERFLEKNDLLWNSTGTGTVGRISVLDEVKPNSLVADSHVTVIRPIKINSNFIWCYVAAPGIQLRIEPGSEKALVSGTTNQVELNTSEVVRLIVPIPPINEQHRIVAKVDELMALCDQLEQEQTDSIAAHQTLVQTLLDTLIARDGVYAGNAGAISGDQAADAAEFEQAWSRIADHFDTLFTTEASIDQLKQTLLQLAVMGKLVPQNANDEAASVLLKNVVQEKSELIKEGILKTQKPLPPVSEDEMVFNLPIGWAWTRLDNLSLHSEAGWSPNCESIQREGENWGVLKVSAVTWGKFKPEENKALPKALEPKPEFEVMAGDFLISRANTAELVARAVIVPEKSPNHLMMSDKIIRFVFSKKISTEFISLVNGSDHSRSYYAKVAGGTSSSMKNVSREQIRMLVIALPPLAEQHRIVAKVDELMALCDTLKASIANAQTTQLHLADVIVEQAVA